MLGLIALAASFAASWFGYSTARRFVRERLRYVDAAHSTGAAIMAGLVAAIVAYPIAGILPLVGPGTAIVFGIGTGLGARAGSVDVKQGYRITSG